MMNTLQASSDFVEFAALPLAVRSDVDFWIAHFREIKKPIVRGLKAIAGATGIPFETVRRKFYAFQREGWKALVNRTKVRPADELNLTEEFLEWFKGLVEKNQRKDRPAWRVFRKMWTEGKTIPGLDNSLPRHELPPGCSYANLQRKSKDRFAREAMRRGLGFAIGSSGPQVFSTRKNLWAMSHVMIDDLWHDNFVVFGNGKNAQIVRVLELDALDVFTGCKIAWGCKPRVRREDGSMENLSERWARLIVASTLWQFGFSPRGTVWMAEHGTAAINERIQQLLADRFGKIPGTNKWFVDVRRSGITGEEQAIMGMRGQGKGNFRFKAPLESLRNLLHNELAALPAQTGRNRDERPEFTHGELKEAEDWIKAVMVLGEKNPARAALVKNNLLNYHADFLPLLTDLYREINLRDWHCLEGWSEIPGNVITEYRIAPTERWLNDVEFSNLPAPIRGGVLEAAKEAGGFVRPRKLSPLEAWRRHTGGAQGLTRPTLTAVPPFVIAEILSEDFAREYEVEGAYFKTFSDEEISPEPLRFESVVINPEGERIQLRDGKYLGFVNPFDASAMFVHDAQQRCLGVAARVTRADRADDAALEREYGNRAKRVSELLQPIRARHAQGVREHAALLEHNGDVIAGKTVEEERKEKREEKKLRDAAESALDAEAI